MMQTEERRNLAKLGGRTRELTDVFTTHYKPILDELYSKGIDVAMNVHASPDFNEINFPDIVEDQKEILFKTNNSDTIFDLNNRLRILKETVSFEKEMLTKILNKVKRPSYLARIAASKKTQEAILEAIEGHHYIPQVREGNVIAYIRRIDDERSAFVEVTLK